MSKKGGILAAAGVIVVGALVAVIVVLVGKLNATPAEQPQPEPERRSVLITEDNVEEVLEESTADTLIPTSYSVDMTTVWRYENGSAESYNARVENSPNNTNDVYFDVSLADTGEVLYESPVIPLGKSISNMALNRALDAGTYECVCTYYLLNANQDPIGSLSVGMTIDVEN